MTYAAAISPAVPAGGTGGADCHATCDVCWGGKDEKWPCAKQRTAPQAECAPRALTDEEMLDAIAAVCSFDRAGVDRWKTEALLIGRAIEQAVNKGAGND